MTIPHSLTCSATTEAIAALRMLQHSGQDISQMSESQIIEAIIKAGVRLAELDATFQEIRGLAMQFDLLAEGRRYQ